MLDVKLLPFTVKLCDDDGVPVVVEKPIREDGETVTEGVFELLLAVTVKLSMLIFGLEPVVPLASPL